MRSQELAAAFEQVFDKALHNQPGEHVGMKYQGHGANVGNLFNDLLVALYADNLLTYFTTALGRKLDYLDWGTQCDDATYGVLADQYRYADYIVASDLERGGFNFDGNEYLRYGSTYNYPSFFSRSTSIRDSLVNMATSEYNFWNSPNTRQMMTTGQVKQSLSVFDCSKFSTLASAITLPPGDNGDLLLWLQANAPSAVSAFYDLRFYYVSNKSFFSWNEDSNGLRGRW